MAFDQLKCEDANCLPHHATFAARPKLRIRSRYVQYKKLQMIRVYHSSGLGKFSATRRHWASPRWI